MTPCWAAGLQQNISGWRPTNFLSNFELKKHAGAEVRHSKKKPHPQLCWLSGKGGTSGLLSKIVYSSLHRAFKSLELCACSCKYSASWGKRGKGTNDKCLAVTLHELHTVGTGYLVLLKLYLYLVPGIWGLLWRTYMKTVLRIPIRKDPNFNIVLTENGDNAQLADIFRLSATNLCDRSLKCKLRKGYHMFWKFFSF